MTAEPDKSLFCCFLLKGSYIWFLKAKEHRTTVDGLPQPVEDWVCKGFHHTLGGRLRHTGTYLTHAVHTNIVCSCASRLTNNKQ